MISWITYYIKLIESPTMTYSTWHILGQPYSLSPFEFNMILHVTH